MRCNNATVHENFTSQYEIETIKFGRMRHTIHCMKQTENMKTYTV